MTGDLEGFGCGLAEAERAVAVRPPLTPEERGQGREEAARERLRRNRVT